MFDGEDAAHFWPLHILDALPNLMGGLRLITSPHQIDPKTKSPCLNARDYANSNDGPDAETEISGPQHQVSYDAHPVSATHGRGIMGRSTTINQHHNHGIPLGQHFKHHPGHRSQLLRLRCWRRQDLVLHLSIVERLVRRDTATAGVLAPLSQPPGARKITHD